MPITPASPTPPNASAVSDVNKSKYAQQASSLLLERASAIITWLVVSGFSIGLMISEGEQSNLNIGIAGVLCVLFLFVWLYATTESKHEQTTKYSPKLIAAGVLFLLVVAIYFYIPFIFVAIFMVLFGAITPYYMSIKRAFMFSPVYSSALFFVHVFYWDHGLISVAISSFLFWTFNLFGLVMINSNLREREARMQTEMINSKLVATQSLLNEAVKQSERIRIARNIHDLLGHHLTALTINLQVASRQSEGTVKDNIEQCHQLSKLLLSDVREAVSDIRDKGKLDLAASIQNILVAIPTLHAHVDVDENVNVSDMHVADTIIKCVQESITNTLRHANGKHLEIALKYANSSENTQAKQIELTIQNDGKMPSNITLGNGLTGIKERLFALQGSAEFALESGKFLTRILIPVPQHD